MTNRAALFYSYLTTAALSACVTSSTGVANPAELTTFAEFISTAEAAAANNQNALVVAGTPHVGRDFVVRSGRIAKGVFVTYEFFDSPCVTPTTARTEVIRLGFVKVKRSVDPHGGRRHEIADASRYAVQETYAYGNPDGTRSINLDYSTASGQECLNVIFIDFPE